MDGIIKIEHLYKSYGDVQAVKDLSFKVKKGELFAFLGLNGAGKSTTISIMCGSLKKDEGMVEINGKNIDEDMSEIKRDIGVVFQNSVLAKPISVYENLKTRAALYGIKGAAFEKRMKEHKERRPNCAKYTRSHPVKRLVALWETENYDHARKAEYAVKHLTRKQKDELVSAPEKLTELCPNLAELEFAPVNDFEHILLK